MILQTRFVYKNGAITAIRNWFMSFRVGNFDLKNEGRKTTENPRCSVQEIVNITNIPKTTVHNQNVICQWI